MTTTITMTTAVAVTDALEAGDYALAREAVAVLPDMTGRDGLVLRRLAFQLNALIASHEAAVSLRAVHAETLAECGADYGATRGAAYIAACASKAVAVDALAVRASILSLRLGRLVLPATLAVELAETELTGDCLAA